MNFKDNNNLTNLISQAGSRAGVDPQSLKEKIEGGKLDELVAKMNPNDAQKFKNVMSNPLLAQQMLNTPQAQMMIKKFMK